MPNPQFITAGRCDLVAVTRAEFETLVERSDAEDDADAALFAERMADLEADRDQRIPGEVTALLLSGDSLLRALRKWRGRTQLDLARATNLTEGYISELESGAKPGSLTILRTIARAFEVPEEWVVPEGMAQE